MPYATYTTRIQTCSVRGKGFCQVCVKAWQTVIT